MPGAGESECVLSMSLVPKVYDGLLSSLNFSGLYAPGAGNPFGLASLTFTPKEYAIFSL